MVAIVLSFGEAIVFVIIAFGIVITLTATGLTKDRRSRDEHRQKWRDTKGQSDTTNR